MSARQRRIARLAAWIAAAPLAVLLLLFGLIQTPPGKRMLAGIVEDAASTPESRIAITGLHGFVPGDLRVEQLTVADRDGVWLVAKSVSLDWSPLSLLRDRLRIERLQAAHVEIARQPITPKTDAKAKDGGAGSGLPGRIDIGAIQVDRLTLGPALAGETAQWKLTGSARVAGLSEDNWLKIDAKRIDGGDGVLTLDGRYQGAIERLDIKLLAEEGAATVNRFSRLEGKQGIAMRADIGGPLKDLNGTLTIDAGELLRIDGTVRARQENGATQATLGMNGSVGRLGAAPWLETIRGDWQLQAEGSFETRTIVLRQATLKGPAGSLTGSGQIDRRNDTGDLTFAAEAISAAFAKLLPATSWQSLQARGRLNGKLMQPTIAAIVTADQLRFEDVTLTRGTANLDAVVQPDGVRQARLQSELEGIVLPAANGRNLTTRASLSALVRQTRDGLVSLQDFKLASPVLTAQGSGQFDPKQILASGKVQIEASDLAVFAEALDKAVAGKLQLTLQAEQRGDRTDLALDGTLENGTLPKIPAPLLAPQVSVRLRGALEPDEAWQIGSLSVQSGAGKIEAQGQGKGRYGSGQASWDIANLAAFDPQLAGRSSGSLQVEESAEAMTARLRASLAEGKFGAADIPRLALDLDARRSGGQTSGTLSLDGEMQKSPIKGGGDFAVSDDGRATIGEFDLRWASIAIVGTDFAVASSGATGALSIKAERLQELNPFLPTKLAGSIDASLRSADARKIALNASVQGFRFGDQVAIDRGRVEGEVADPLGRMEFTLAAKATGGQLAGPLREVNAKASGERANFAFNLDGTGDKLRATAQGRAAIAEDAASIDVQSLTMVYAGQTVSLATSARVRIAGPTTTIERATIRAGGGTVTANGAVGPDSNLDVQARALPLSLLKIFDPEMQIFGTANATASVRGNIAQPQIDATLEASDMRLRTIRTAGIPPGALAAKANIRDGAATIEGRFTAGQGNTLNFSGSGPLLGPEGVSDGRLRLDGAIKLAQLTPFLGGNGRLSGELRIDLALSASGGAIGGDGSIRIVDGHYFNFAEGLAIRDIDAVFAVAGDRLEVRQFSARPRSGEIALTGSLQFDRQLTLPVDIGIVARSARILDRRDMQATVSANLRLNGSAMQGMTLGGTATVERAEVNLDANVNQGPQIASLDVREINRPSGAPDDKARQPKPPGPETRLAIKLNAPQNVFVRGRGLDVEMGGALDIAGTVRRPQILGALQLRRGTFSGTQRRLEFTRGAVTFPDPDRLQPLLDFTASTRIDGGTAEIVITGTPDAPKVTLNSSPPLPQDEIMARLLFGRSTSQLSPLQLAQIGQSIGTLSGLTGPGGGILDNLRKAFGFDRLGVSSDPDAVAAGSSPIGGSSLEVGRNIAPGVYVGAKQGATSDSSSAVVEIELTPHVKVESEIGTGARSRIGVAVEWDY